MANNFYSQYNLYKYYHKRFDYMGDLHSIDRMLISAINLHRQGGFADVRFEKTNIRKPAGEITGHTIRETSAQPDFKQDRVFPLDSVTVQSFQQECGKDIKEPVLIHYGYGFDMFTSSLHALAIAIGYDIYFRNTAFRPENEAGRELLFHEMTHAAQYAGGKITAKAGEEQLKNEAELVERRSRHQAGKWIPVEAHEKYSGYGSLTGKK